MEVSILPEKMSDSRQAVIDAAKRVAVMTDDEEANVRISAGEMLTNCRRHGEDECADIEVHMLGPDDLAVTIEADSLRCRENREAIRHALMSAPQYVPDMRESGRGMLVLSGLAKRIEVSEEGTLTAVFAARTRAIVPVI